MNNWTKNIILLVVIATTVVDIECKGGRRSSGGGGTNAGGSRGSSRGGNRSYDGGGGNFNSSSSSSGGGARDLAIEADISLIIVFVIIILVCFISFARYLCSHKQTSTTYGTSRTVTESNGHVVANAHVNGNDNSDLPPSYNSIDEGVHGLHVRTTSEQMTLPSNGHVVATAHVNGNDNSDLPPTYDSVAEGVHGLHVRTTSERMTLPSNGHVVATAHVNGNDNSDLPPSYNSVVTKSKVKTNNKILNHAGEHGVHVWTTSERETLPPTTMATINETERGRNHPTGTTNLVRNSQAVMSMCLPFIVPPRL